MIDPASTPVRAREETFVVDREYPRHEAREAPKTFFAPFSGIHAAFRSDPAGE